jgi:uncharacterized protein (DUF4415 family)
MTDGNDKRRKGRATVEAEDIPELTDAEIADMRPAAEVVPEIVRAFRGPQKAPTKVQVTVRFDADVIARLKKGGRGWQTRANDLLRKALRLPKEPRPVDR